MLYVNLAQVKKYTVWQCESELGIAPLTKSRKGFLRKNTLVVSKKCIFAGPLIKKKKKLKNRRKQRHIILSGGVGVWWMVRLYYSIQSLDIMGTYCLIKKATIQWMFRLSIPTIWRLLTMHLVFAVVNMTLIVLITPVLQFIKKILWPKMNGYGKMWDTNYKNDVWFPINALSLYYRLIKTLTIIFQKSDLKVNMQ